MPTVHFSGQVDCQAVDYTIAGRNLIEELESQPWHDNRAVRVYHDGELVAEGPLSFTAGRVLTGSGHSQIGGLTTCDVGGYDVLEILEDCDGCTVDLLLTDEPEPVPEK